MATSGYDEDDPTEWLNETGITTCSTCGGLMEILDYEDIPEDVDLELNIDPGENGFYLHCPACDKYAVGGFGGSSCDEPPASKSSTLISTPSLNAPCPCGSGKKYKRCCGK
jgi:hypothetical protein